MEVIEIDFNDASSVERYNRLFDECPDAFIQQSTYWCSVIKDLGPDVPIFLLISDDGRDIAGLPLYLFNNPNGNILTSVPQPGPLGGIFHRRGLDDRTLRGIYEKLLAAALGIAREKDCISFTVITNPFRDDIELYKPCMGQAYILENFTQYIALDEIFEGERIVLRDYNRRTNLSRNVRKASGKGYEVKFSDSKDELKRWYEVHRKRHIEINAKPLEFGLFENIFNLLVTKNKARLLLVKDGDEICSGCFFIYHKDVMDVFMLSMNSDYAKSMANYANVDSSLYWARKMGTSLYNWQSSRSKENGVYYFKKQWGSREAPYYFITKLLCEPERINRIGIDKIREEYKWHYVVPFGVFTEGFETLYFRKY